MNRAGRYDDVSLVSGIDFTEDGRGFAFGDFDKDGNLELGIVSNQSPRVRIAKATDNAAPTVSKDDSYRWVKIRLIGGNETAAPNLELSPRDPVGAILVARTASSTRMFQLARGEGFSVQNSQTMHIGLGKDTKIDKLTIRWPSGRTTVHPDIMAGSSIRILETENRDSPRFGN